MAIDPLADRATGNGQPARGEVAVLHKALGLLECLGTGPMTAAELSRQLGIAKPTVYRIIRTLLSREFINKERDGSRYMIGTALYALGSAHRSADLVSLTRPHVVRLAARFGETVNVAVPMSNEILYVDVLESMHQLRTQIPPGTRDELHSTALGKAILAAIPEEEATAIITAANLLRKTPNTIVTVHDLQRCLSNVRELGYAIDNEENELGSVCVASALRGPHGRPIGAISVSGPKWRITDELVAVIGSALVDISKSLGEALGLYTHVETGSVVGGGDTHGL